MSDNDFEDFFNGAGGEFTPGAKFTNDTGPEGRTQVGGKIVGTIVSMKKQGQTKPNGDPVLNKKTGEQKSEVKMVLDTEYRNWDKVAKVPHGEDGSTPLPGTDDNGQRAIYVRGWMIGAVGDACKAAGVRAPAIGGKLAVKVTELVPTNPGENPYAKYEALYQAPAGDEGMFAEAQDKAAAAADDGPGF